MHAVHNTSAAEPQTLAPTLSDDWLSAEQAPLPTSGGDGAIAQAAAIDNDGVHHFTAIRPDVGPVAFLNFRLPRDAAMARDWVNGFDGDVNIHYTLNEVREGCDAVKPSKADVVAIRGAHGDVDLAGANTDEVMAALPRQVKAKLPIEASTFLSSGGGVQVTFRLKQKLPVAEAGDRIEAINNGIIAVLGGDRGTWNLDRVLRVAGTQNLPDSRKRAKGRVQRKATMLATSDARYTLDELERAFPPVQIEEVGDSSERINELITELRYSAHETVVSFKDLTPELAAKLDAAMGASQKLRHAFAGDLSQTAAADGEGKRATVALLLAHHGDFDLEELAALIWLWAVMIEGMDYADAKLTPRDIARLYARKVEPEMRKRADRAAVAERNFEAPIADTSDEPAATNEAPKQMAETKAAEPPTFLIEPQDIFGYGDMASALDVHEGVFSDLIDTFATDQSRRVGMPKAYVALSALVTLAGSVGNKVHIQPKANDTEWTEPAILWGLLAGGVGSKKTPAMKVAVAPLSKVDSDRAAAGYERHAEWTRQRAMATKKDEKAALPPEPSIERNLVVNATTEAVAEILGDSPAAVLLYQDELTAWLGSMDAYKSSKGGDRGLWLQFFNGDRLPIDRVGRRQKPVKFFGGSILGGIQPDKIRQVADTLDDDGMMQRFLVVYFEDNFDGIDQDIDEAPDHAAGAAYRALVTKWATASSSVPKMVVRLSAEAQEVWRPLAPQIRAMAHEQGLSDAWRGHLAKWPGISARLLLLCHLIDNADAETHEIDGIPVSAATARRAVKMCGWFLINSLRFYSECIGGGEAVNDARWIAGHILTKPGKTRFSRNDIGDARKDMRGQDDRIHRAMSILDNIGWVLPNNETWLDSRRRPTQWTVCPAVHGGRFASRAEIEQKERSAKQAGIRRAAVVRAQFMGANSVFD